MNFILAVSLSTWRIITLTTRLPAGSSTVVILSQFSNFALNTGEQ
jgi:hypothetical protein